MKISKKKLLIFDLDGVLFDSKKNMELAWNSTSKKFDLDVPFSLYFKKIGMPFSEILKSLDIKPKKKIIDHFRRTSLKKINKIKPYKNAIKNLKFLKKKKIKFSIVTSKDLKRTKFLLNKFKIYPNSIHCPNNKYRGKPFPDHILNSITKNNVKRKDACFFGDMKVDYLAANNAKIDFVFASYGYGKKKSFYKNKIKNLNEIKKFINIIY